MRVEPGRLVSKEGGPLTLDSRMVHSERACTGLAIALALGIGWVDLHTTEVTVTVVGLLTAGLLLGLLRPARPWRWAVLLAAGLPAVAILGRLLRVRTAEPIHLDPRVVLVALVFASIGCYGGAAIRRSLARA